MSFPLPTLATYFPFVADNQIDGECFLELSESEVKELVKPLGIVKKILRILRKVIFFNGVCLKM